MDGRCALLLGIRRRLEAGTQESAVVLFPFTGGSEEGGARSEE